MDILYRLIRDICLFIIIGVFLTENPIVIKLLISLLALVVYFFTNKGLDSVESNQE